MIGIDFSSRVGTEIRVELEQLYAGLKEQADNDLIIESAIVTNRTRDSQDAKVDCIVVDAETRMGFSAYILFDYQLNEGLLNIAVPKIILHEPRIFIHLPKK